MPPQAGPAVLWGQVLRKFEGMDLCFRLNRTNFNPSITVAFDEYRRRPFACRATMITWNVARPPQSEID